MTDGATFVFWPSEFPPFSVDFTKVFFHKNIVLTLPNTTKKESVKSVS